MMKPEIGLIVGKRIAGVVVKQWDRSPRSQIFLVFDDETSYELYSNAAISGISGLNFGGLNWVKRYLPEAEIIFEMFTLSSSGELGAKSTSTSSTQEDDPRQAKIRRLMQQDTKTVQ
jgi:hypothetical protein